MGGMCGRYDMEGGAERNLKSQVWLPSASRQKKKPLVSSCSANLIKLQLIQCGERFDICLRN